MTTIKTQKETAKEFNKLLKAFLKEKKKDKRLVYDYGKDKFEVETDMGIYLKHRVTDTIYHYHRLTERDIAELKSIEVERMDPCYANYVWDILSKIVLSDIAHTVFLSAA